MSLGVSSGDLIGSWSLSFSDIAFVTGKAETARLGLAVQLRFFAGHGFFVPDHASIPSDGVLYLAEQLGLDAKSVNHYDFSGRTARRHCAEILRHLGFRRMTQTDRRALSRWISDDLCAGGQPINAMLEHVFLWCRDRRIYGPSRKELERLVRSQRHLYLEALLARVRDRLAPDAVALLEASLADPDGPTGFNTMKGDAGQATLENILGVTAKLAFIQRLALPRDFLSVTGKAWVDQIVRRVAGEKASEMRRHVPARQLGLYAVYLMAREAQLTDAMVDLLIETGATEDRAAAEEAGELADGSMVTAMLMLNPEMRTLREAFFRHLARLPLDPLPMTEEVVAAWETLSKDSHSKRINATWVARFAIEFYQSVLRILAGADQSSAPRGVSPVQEPGRR